MKRFFVLLIIIAIVFSGCGSYSPLAKVSLKDIDKVQMVLAGGNPEYGFESKVFTNKEDIDRFVSAVSSATVKEAVEDDNIVISDVSKLVFYSEDKKVGKVIFNGNDSLRVWSEDAFYYVEYDKDTPYEIYEKSEEKVIIIDAKAKDDL